MFEIVYFFNQIWITGKISRYFCITVDIRGDVEEVERSACDLERAFLLDDLDFNSCNIADKISCKVLFQILLFEIRSYENSKILLVEIER